MTNTNTTNTIDWARLAAPFDPADVSFRVQSTYERGGKTLAVVVAYIDARNVADRLDAVVGPEGWAFDWQPVVTGNSAVLAAKGTLTIAGVSKSDVGDAGTTEPTKASVSDALKRAAVLWGIGRYLYDLPFMTATPEQRGKSWVLPRAEEERLRREVLHGKPAAQSARPQPAQSAPDAQEAPVKAATPDQWQRIRKACELLHREPPTDDALTFVEADVILSHLTEEWKRAKQAGGKAAAR